MIYTPLTNKALRFAYNAHMGQMDYNGVPYIFHPLHLAGQMDDEISCCAALLHDVVEDTQVTLEELGQEFPAQVVEVVALLTHGEDEPYDAYIRRLRHDPIAKKIKLADIDHNSDQSRCAGSGLSQEQLAYWRQKYTRAKAILTQED